MNNKKLMSYLPGYALLISVTAIILIPFYWMVVTSVKREDEIMSFPPSWWPEKWQFQNYFELFQAIPFHKYMFNSIYIAVVVTVFTCFLAALAGFAFAKLHFPFRNALFLMLLSSMMIPVEVTTIPLFLLFSKLGLTNTHFPLIVPTILGSTGMFGVFLLRQFYLTIPDEISEAARIDGCTPWMTFHRIMLPMVVPAISSLAIFAFLHSWNEFFEPLIYINSDHLYTVPLGLSIFSGDLEPRWHLIMAASVVATLPLLLVFFFAQQRIIEGISMTGSK